MVPAIQSTRFQIRLLIEQKPLRFVECLRAQYGTEGTNMQMKDSILIGNNFDVDSGPIGVDYCQAFAARIQRQTKAFDIELRLAPRYSVPEAYTSGDIPNPYRVGLVSWSPELNALRVEARNHFTGAQKPASNRFYNHTSDSLSKIRICIARRLDRRSQKRIFQEIASTYHNEVVGKFRARGIRIMGVAPAIRLGKSVFIPRATQIGGDYLFQDGEQEGDTTSED